MTPRLPRASVTRPVARHGALRGDVLTREGVDRVYAGRGVPYFSRLIAKATQSRLNRLAALTMYQHMTIRNWNTTTRLADLLAGGAG